MRDECNLPKVLQEPLRRRGLFGWLVSMLIFESTFLNDIFAVRLCFLTGGGRGGRHDVGREVLL
jgi:hypothetical protein